MAKLTLPVDELKLLTVCKAAIERLIECEEIRVDNFGFPYWESCGEYLDGVKRWKDDEVGYYPDGVPVDAT